MCFLLLFSLQNQRVLPVELCHSPGLTVSWAGDPGDEQVDGSSPGSWFPLQILTWDIHIDTI